MDKSLFYYDLPASLIAQHPLPQRSASRLLCLEKNNGQIRDQKFPDLLEKLQPGDVLVFNDTKVIPARLFGKKATGGRVEILIERCLDERQVIAQIKASKSPKPGTLIALENNTNLVVVERQNCFFRLQTQDHSNILNLIEQYGHMPLPPYIQRSDDEVDHRRYQTVYAVNPGAVAAPTAGLHFDHDLIERIKAKGIGVVYVTLHVGAGTFQPIRCDNIHSHRMHAEVVNVAQDACKKINAARQCGKKVVAVGTTAVRALESAAGHHGVQPYTGETRIFIYPGYQFKCVDAMITNFHLPESTLVMLVCALGGYDHVMEAYHHAVAQQYRFYSYGDAMYIS